MTGNLITLPPALDLRKRHFEASVHGIVIIGTWLREGRNRFQPCMVLLHPTRPIAAGRTVPIVIPLSEAWRWAMHGEVGDPGHCVAQIIDWLSNGLLPGNPASKRDHMRIMDAINQRLPDLITMPPAAIERGTVFAEMTATNTTTGEKFEKEVRFDG